MKAGQMRDHRLFVPAGLILSLLAGCGHHANNVSTQSAGAGQAASGGTTIVAAGTNYYGKLEQPIGSKTSQEGDKFVLDETRAGNPDLKGSVIEGHLANLQAAGPMRNPKMTIVFDDIRLPDGTTAPIDVQLISLGAFSPKTHHLRTIGMMIGGAVAGHVAARAAGKSHGALLGAAGAYALSQNLKTDIAVPAGTILQVRFKSPVTSGATKGTPSNS
jgi:hypothetical protein